MSLLFESVLNGALTAKGFFICLVTSLLCGIIAAFSASFKSYSSKSYIIALILLPMIVHTVITMVNGNIGTGVAVMGAFSLVRFRSVPGKAKDIASIFLAMTSGLACAAGYIGIALLFTVVIALIMIILCYIPLGDERMAELHITVPETLRFSGEFDDLFKKYTKKHRLIKTKTTNMGSLYKLLYKVEIKDSENIQSFIDELRCRNGNLEIAIIQTHEGSDEL